MISDMTLRELSKLYYLNREIEMNRQRLGELQARAESPAQGRLTGTSCTPGKTDTVSKYAAEIADLREIIDANVRRCFFELNRLNRYINEVPDPQMRVILSLRFVNGLSWQQVAASVGGNNTGDSVRKACARFLKKN